MKVCPKCGNRCESYELFCPICKNDLMSVKSIYRNIKYPNDYQKKPLNIIENKDDLDNSLYSSKMEGEKWLF